MNKVILKIPRNRKKVRIVRAESEINKELIEIRKQKLLEDQIKKEESRRRLLELLKLQNIKRSKEERFYESEAIKRREAEAERKRKEKTFFTEKFVISNSNQPVQISLNNLPIDTIPLDEAKIEVQNAYDKGFNDGQEAAGNVYKSEIESHLRYIKRIDKLSKNLRDNYKKELKELEDSLIDMSILIAKHIINKEIESDENLVIDNVKKAINTLDGEDIFKIVVNPEDYDILQKAKSSLVSDSSTLQNVVISTDNTIEKGMCILHTGAGIIDATLSGQLNQIKDALLEEFKESKNIVSPESLDDGIDDFEEYDPNNDLEIDDETDSENLEDIE